MHIEIVQVEENGSTVFYLQHNASLRDIPDHPANGPYATKLDAQEAAGRLRAAWGAARDANEGSLADPISGPTRGAKTFGEP